MKPHYNHRCITWLVNHQLVQMLINGYKNKCITSLWLNRSETYGIINRWRDSLGTDYSNLLSMFVTLILATTPVPGCCQATTFRHFCPTPVINYPSYNPVFEVPFVVARRGYQTSAPTPKPPRRSRLGEIAPQRCALKVKLGRRLELVATRNTGSSRTRRTSTFHAVPTSPGSTAAQHWKLL